MITRKFHALLCLFTFLIISLTCDAQSPQGIPYQAVARNAGGDLLINKTISLRFSLHDLNSTGSIIYQETQSVTTGSFGLFNVNIGEGSVTIGSFSLINWSSGSKYLQVELDTTGGVSYIDMGTQKLMSVPYALYSGNGGSWITNGTGIYNSNTGNVGVGVSSPDVKLHVYDSATPTMLTIGGSAINGGYTALSLGVSSDMNGYSVLQSVKSSGSSYGDLILNPNDGNIGIGTTFPRRKLEIRGDISLGDWTTDSPSRRIGVMDGTTQTAGIEIENTTVGGNYSQKMYFITHHSFNSYGRRATIDEDGNFGLGTETPSAKFDVIGNVRIADGTQGIGKILKSDANGFASWGTFNSVDLFGGSVPSNSNFSCLNVIGTDTTSESPFSLCVQGNYAYFLNFSNSSFHIVDISNPSAPVTVSSTNGGTSVKAMAVHGNFAYVLNYSSNRIRIYDISNPSLPVLVSTLNAYSSPYSIDISSNYAYVVSPISGMLGIIDISNPASPTVVSSCNVGVDASVVSVSGNYAYIINTYANNLKIVDVSNPLAPIVVSTIATGSYPLALTVSGNYAYVANYLSSSVSVFDISVANTPALVSSISTGAAPGSVKVSGNNLMVACYQNNVLQVFNVSNPAAPVAIGVVTTATGTAEVNIIGSYPIVLCNTSKKLQVFATCPSSAIIDPNSGTVTPQFVTWNYSGVNISNANGGNVGIGTSSPQNKLSVSGNADVTGSVAIGITNPSARLHLKDGALLCNGTIGGIPVTGAGTRMMWIPSVSSFRAGVASATSWDASNIGLASFAAGTGTIASGLSSFAMGLNTTSSNNNSFAIGFSTNASGESSVAMGNNSQSSGNASVAMGHNANASNTDAVAIGTYANASGPGAIAMGSLAVASGADALAFGPSTNASGTASIALGNNVSTNLKSGSFVMGDYQGANLTNDVNNQFASRFRGGYKLFTNITLTTGVSLSAGAGAWTSVSDRDKKENFKSIDAEDVLQKVAKLPISSWNYKSQPTSQRHVGCMAQDFYAAFKLDGESDTTINTLDIDGINMTAIQALTARTDALKIVSDQLKSTTEDLKLSSKKIEMLEKEIAELKKLMNDSLKK